jgi:prolyl oligopeptidase
MKIGFDRRQFLAGSAGAFSMTLMPRSLMAAGGSAVPLAPAARIDVVHDTYFGETLSDPYRWMENDKDPAWLPYLKGQNDHARAVLDAIPEREALMRRIQQLSGDTAITSQVPGLFNANDFVIELGLGMSKKGIPLTNLV